MRYAYERGNTWKTIGLNTRSFKFLRAISLGFWSFSRLCFWGLAYTKEFRFWTRCVVGIVVGTTKSRHSVMISSPTTIFKQDAANWAFFPLFPVLLALFNKVLLLPYKVAGLIITNLCMFFAIKLSLNYLKETRPKVAEHFWVWLCATGPYAFYFTNGYSEALFWFLGCGAFLLWHRKQYLQAGAVTALLCATRLFGLFWLVAYLAKIMAR